MIPVLVSTTVKCFECSLTGTVGRITKFNYEMECVDGIPCETEDQVLHLLRPQGWEAGFEGAL